MIIELIVLGFTKIEKDNPKCLYDCYDEEWAQSITRPSGDIIVISLILDGSEWMLAEDGSNTIFLPDDEDELLMSVKETIEYMKSCG